MKKATQSFLRSESLNDCNEEFKKELSTFIDTVAEKVDNIIKRYGKSNAGMEIERLTCSQLVTFLETCGQKYVRSIIEPGIITIICSLFLKKEIERNIFIKKINM